ncbi:unnamed protein product, partial [Dracunculus medinensis]|uniref:SLBP_RNA_bind domain-containing protein n=1 Tax=Dracunculus medinensis TaxID=318479 RepID=A0A0N4U2F8_DRAME
IYLIHFSISSVDSNCSRCPHDVKEGWKEPKNGWCNDEKILARRTKEIRRAKEKPIYIRYITEVPKVSRVKGIHPRTPNKFLNFSRRSWDAQVNFELFCINLIVDFRENPDAMASLLGHFDIDKEDESTLKAIENSCEGPKDFSETH